MQTFEHILEISHQFKGILLDANGVFYAGKALGLFPHADETLKRLIDLGKVVGILSNSSQVADHDIQKYQSLGLRKHEHYHFYLSSGELTRHQILKKSLPFQIRNNLYFPLCTPHPKYMKAFELFKGTHLKSTQKLEDADFIYASIPHIDGIDQENIDFLRELLFKFKALDLPMLCANPDRYAYEGNPPVLVARQGSAAALYQSLGGAVYYIGKPEKLAFECAIEAFNQYQKINLHEILMIGDTPETDIRGANRMGISSALILETGVMKDRINKIGLAESINMLPSEDKPTFQLKRFSHEI